MADFHEAEAAYIRAVDAEITYLRSLIVDQDGTIRALRTRCEVLVRAMKETHQPANAPCDKQGQTPMPEQPRSSILPDCTLNIPMPAGVKAPKESYPPAQPATLDDVIEHAQNAALARAKQPAPAPVNKRTNAPGFLTTIVRAFTGG